MDAPQHDYCIDAFRCERDTGRIRLEQDRVRMILLFLRRLKHTFRDINADISVHAVSKYWQRFTSTATQLGHCTEPLVTCSLEHDTIEMCEIRTGMRISEIGCV